MTRRSEPLVSILIPAYNSERWVAEAIRSALAQTWKKKEIVVVDDGSVDRTLAIAKQFASRHVQVISQDNQGAAAARNRAYSVCQGDYIQWLDADDLLDPEKISLQIRAAKRYASTRTLLSAAWGYFFYRHQKARFSPDTLWCDLSPAEWMMRQMEQNLHMQTATWLVSRELAESAGPWDTRMLVDDDGEYFCRVMLGSDGIRFVPGARTYYRRSGFNGLSYIGGSNEKRDAQFLSMRLHIRYLLSIYDHERSRAACRRYLQTWLVIFYPDRPDILQQAHLLAAELGGTLDTPCIPRQYRWIGKLLGWDRAYRARMFLPAIKHGLMRSCDRALWYLRKSAPPAPSGAAPAERAGSGASIHRSSPGSVRIIRGPDSLRTTHRSASESEIKPGTGSVRSARWDVSISDRPRQRNHQTKERIS